MKIRIACTGNLLMAGLLIVFACFSCTVPESAPSTLKEAYKDHFLVGAAIGRYELSGRDSLGLQLVEKHFNSITATNMMKWEKIHPKPGEYNFEPVDRFIEFGEKHGMDIVGHVLVWHNQTPRWVFEDDAGKPVVRDTLIQRMRDHIFTVMGRYKGRVHSWDVVNEPIGDDGNLRKTRWTEIIGDDFVQLAFEFAREADSEAILIYNDYSIPDPKRRDGTVRFIRDLKSKGVPVDAVGLQAHYLLDYPTMPALDSTIVALSDLGCRIHVTELDINVLPNPTARVDADIRRREEFQEKYNPYTEGLPDSVQVLLAEQYANLFKMFVRHADKIDRVTFWGVHDGTSWKNNFPIFGRTNYPLLFDREYQPKPAFDAVMEAAVHAE